VGDVLRAKCNHGLPLSPSPPPPAPSAPPQPRQRYLVGDVLRAKCESAIRLELTDMQGNPVTSGYPDLTFEVRASGV
jgi:hypothetical protein